MSLWETGVFWVAGVRQRTNESRKVPGGIALTGQPAPVSSRNEDAMSMTLTLTEREVGWLVGLLTSAAAEVDAAALSESMVQPLTTEEAADLVDAAAWARRLLAQMRSLFPKE